MVRSSFPKFSRSVTRPCAKPCSLITAPRRVYTRIHARSQKTMPSKFLWPIKTRLPRGRKNISRSRVERQRERSFHRRRDIFTRARASSLCTVGETFRHAWTNAEIFFNSSASLTEYVFTAYFSEYSTSLRLSLSSSSSLQRNEDSFFFILDKKWLFFTLNTRW